MSKKKGKNKPTKKQIQERERREQYSRERSRIVKRINALKQKGYIFDEDAIPQTLKELGRTPSKKDITNLSKQTPQVIRKNAVGFVNTYTSDTGELMSPEVGISIEQKLRQYNAKINLLQAQLINEKKRSKAVRSDKEFIGNNLFNILKRIDNKEERDLFLSYLTDEELNELYRARGRYTEGLNLLNAAKKAREEREKEKERAKNARQKRKSQSQSGQNLAPDEGDESQLPISPKDEGNSVISQGNGSSQSGAGQNEQNDEDSDEDEYDEEYEESDSVDRRSREQIEQDKEKQYEISEKAWKWREDYERQKRVKDWSKREFANDAETIMASIDERISQFEQYMQDEKFDDKFYINGEQVSILKRVIKGAIKRDGLTTVLKRLDGKAAEIDDYLTAILNQYRNHEAIYNGANAIAEIINGRALTQNESFYYANSYGEDYIDDDQDIPLYIVDYDEL